MIKKISKNKLLTPNLLIGFAVSIYCLLLSIEAKALQDGITITFKNELLTDALQKLEKASGYTFAYQSDILPSNYKITRSYKNNSINKILSDLLKGTGIEFQIIDKHIVLKKKVKRKKYTLSGYINDAKTGQKLINVNVYDKESHLGTISDDFGYFNLSLEEGVYTLVFSYIGMEKKEQMVVFDKDQELEIELAANLELSEILIAERQKEPLINGQEPIGKMQISPVKMAKFPIMMAEPDIVKFAQLLPGVQSGMEANGAVYVRGGNSSHNLFLMDNVPLYNCFHLLGLFSVFNTNMVSSTDIYKGAFPASYGGRLSSVMDIKIKEGNFKEIKGKASLGMIASKFFLEGPIVEDKTSFSLSGRFGYYHIYGIFIPSQLTDGNDLNDYYFYDINAKITHRLSKNSIIYATFYNGKDFGETIGTISEGYFYNRFVDGQNWDNLLGTVAWKWKITNWLFSDIQIALSNYNYRRYQNDSSYFQSQTLITSNFNESSIENNVLNQSIISNFQLNITPQINANLGYKYTLLDLTSQNGEKDHFYTNNENQRPYYNDTTFNYYKHNTEEQTAYIDFNFSPFKKLKISVGLHASLYETTDYNNLSFQPRAHTSWEFARGLILKGAYSQMVQHLHLLEATKIKRASDLLVAAIEGAPSETAEHFSGGLSILKPKNFNFHIEFYYKKMNNLVNFKEGASYFSKSNTWVEKIITGDGDSKGIELLIEKPYGKFTGWLGYTISKTNRQFEEINMSRPFPFRFEHRHHLNLVLNYKLSEKWSLAANWLFHTGNKETIPNVFYWDTNASFDKKMTGVGFYQPTKVLYNQKNGYINPNYHRLDLSVNYFRKNRLGDGTWCLSIYNVYNRKNVYASSYNEGWANVLGNIYYNLRLINQHRLFGIIPSISYTLSF